MIVKILGTWCNGSTNDSKSFCKGSNPLVPAKNWGVAK